jgi:hypothetical protein
MYECTRLEAIAMSMHEGNEGMNLMKNTPTHAPTNGARTHARTAEA